MDIRPVFSSLRRHKTAAALIVLQVALTCAIVCNALFLIQQRVERMGMESGLAEDELVLIQPVSLRGAVDGADRDATPDIERSLALLRSIPGVTSVAAVPQMPFGNSSNNTSVSNKPDQIQPTLNAALYMDGEDMLEAFGLRLVSGRNFSSDEYVHVDDLLQQRDAISGVIVNRAMADRLFPGEEALGRLTYGWGDDAIPIIGIVEELMRPNNFELGQYSMIYPIRNYHQGLNYMLRTTPERRLEVLDAAEAARTASALLELASPHPHRPGRLRSDAGRRRYRLAGPHLPPGLAARRRACARRPYRSRGRSGTSGRAPGRWRDL